MSDAAYVEQAAKWSRDLTLMRSRGPGDLENAMRAIEREYGIDYWHLWRLRYTPNRIKDIGVHLYVRLQGAWEAERQRQLRRLQHDITKTEAIRGPSEASVVAAKTVVLPDEGET